jgi:hypothetical protein
MLFSPVLMTQVRPITLVKRLFLEVQQNYMQHHIDPVDLTSHSQLSYASVQFHILNR